MDPRLVELYVARGRLRERIGQQRVQLAGTLTSVSRALHTIDRARALWDRARLWVRANPGVVAVAAVAVVVWRPRSILRSVVWGFSTWRSWGRWRDWIRIGLRAL